MGYRYNGFTSHKWGFVTFVQVFSKEKRTKGDRRRIERWNIGEVIMVRSHMWHLVLQQRVKALIAAEQPLNPYSDRALYDILTIVEQMEDLTFALVQLERQKLGIPTSQKRRQENRKQLQAEGRRRRRKRAKRSRI